MLLAHPKPSATRGPADPRRAPGRAVAPRRPASASSDGELIVLPRTLTVEPDSEVAMVTASAALAEPDPEDALARWLEAVQARQQARLAALAEPFRSEGLFLMHHQRLLVQNQATHDAALAMVRRARSGVRSHPAS